MERYYRCDDEDAFGELEGRYTRRLIGFFWKLGVRPEECQDWTQETWLRVARTNKTGKTGEGRFDPQENRTLKPWLFRIALNLRRDDARDKKRQPVTEGVDDWDRLQPSMAHSQRRAPYWRRDLIDCIEGLENPYRTVVVLRLAGYTFQEIADALDVGIATVYGYEKTAEDKLRACLTARGLIVAAATRYEGSGPKTADVLDSGGEEGK